jgi:hypothetical protein
MAILRATDHLVREKDGRQREGSAGRPGVDMAGAACDVGVLPVGTTDQPTEKVRCSLSGANGVQVQDHVRFLVSTKSTSTPRAATLAMVVNQRQQRRCTRESKG